MYADVCSHMLTYADEDAPLQIAGPLLYAGLLFPELYEVAGRGFATSAELIHARSLIDRCDGVAGIRRLAQYHAALALNSIAHLPESEAKSALTLLVHYSVEEGQPRLLRANYSPEGMFEMSDEAQSVSKAIERAEVAAKKEVYGTLDSLYGRAATGVRAVKESLVRATLIPTYLLRTTLIPSYLGIKDRATSDIKQLQRVAVRDCVLIYGKGVQVPVVVDYVNQQCAFRVSAMEVDKMLLQEIQWQLKNGIESEEDIKTLSGRGAPVLWPADELIA
jgi:hypothetical protein